MHFPNGNVTRAKCHPIPGIVLQGRSWLMVMAVAQNRRQAGRLCLLLLWGCVVCWWVKGLSFWLPPAVKLWKRDKKETEKGGPIKPKGGRNSLEVFSELGAQPSVLTIKGQKVSCECSGRPCPTPLAFLVLFWWVRRVERAREGLNISTVRKVLVVDSLLFLSAGTDRKQWRPVLQSWPRLSPLLSSLQRYDK